jgi:hypothetical protein
MSDKCEMTVADHTGFHFMKCGKPAKFISPAGTMQPNGMKLCGIHRRSVDRMLERNKMPFRCMPIPLETTANNADKEG